MPQLTRRHSLDVNMTPMIDVVFLLIIFFLVSSHLARQESQLPLPLPMADSGQEAPQQTKPRVVVNVRSDGTTILAGRQVRVDELQRRLTNQLKQTSADLEVRIRGDRSVPFRFVRPIMLAASRSGIWNVTFSVIRREDAQ